MNKRTLGAALAVVAGLAAAPHVFAGAPESQCDVVASSGSGTRLENGVMVGSTMMTIVATGEQFPVAFTVVPLGIVNFQNGEVSFASSHEFKGMEDSRINFTTFDEARTIPLQGDPSCTVGECGMVFRLVLKSGIGNYNCGEIVSGYDPSLTTFTSKLHGNTLQINAVGKLCKCRLSGNN